MFIVKTRIYLDKDDYKRIVVVSGGVNDIKTQLLADKPLSTFAGARQYDCISAVMSLKRPDELMISDEIPDLLCYLANNGYVIDTNVSQMYSSNKKISVAKENIICFVRKIE